MWSCLRSHPFRWNFTASCPWRLDIFSSKELQIPVCNGPSLLLEGLKELWILFSLIRLQATTDVSIAFILAPSTDLRSVCLCDTLMLFPQMLTAGRPKLTISIGWSNWFPSSRSFRDMLEPWEVGLRTGEEQGFSQRRGCATASFLEAFWKTLDPQQKSRRGARPP